VNIFCFHNLIAIKTTASTREVECQISPVLFFAAQHP